MPKIRSYVVDFKITVDVGECENADEAWELAVDSLRSGGGDIYGHTLYADDEIEEEVP